MYSVLVYEDNRFKSFGIKTELLEVLLSFGRLKRNKIEQFLGRELKQPTYYAIAEVAFAVKNNDVLICCSFHDAY